MEKTTKDKKEKKKPVSSTKPADVQKFLKGQKISKTSSANDSRSYQIDDLGMTAEDHEVPTDGPFAVIDPIDTPLGPIGKFQMDLEHFPLHPAMCLFGKRRTGKTFTLRDVMAKCFTHIPFGVVFSQTAHNGFWQRYVPSQFVFKDLQTDKMQAFIDRQMSVIEKWRHDHAEEVEKDNDCYKRVPELAAFCILDDVISDRVAVQWSKQLNYFFVNGRHLCCSVFITSQHVKGIGPMIRGNMDIVCLQPIFQLAARMELHDMYAGSMDRNLFFQMMNCIVKDENLEGSTPQDPKKYVRTMFINDFENTTNPHIKYKWSEAEDPGDFKLLHPEYWKKQENVIAGPPKPRHTVDEIDELDEVMNVLGRPQHQ